MIEDVVFIFILGMVGGYISTAVGEGLGALTVSGLVLYGVAPKIAINSSLFQDVAIAAFGGAWHYKFGHVYLKYLLPLGAGAITGIFFGANISTHLLPPEILQALIGAGIVIMGLLIVLKPPKNNTYLNSKKLNGAALVASVGFGAGLLYGMIGGGWGPLTILPLIIIGASGRLAVGSSTLVRPIVALVGGLIYVGTIGFHPEITIPLIAGGLITAPLGAMTTRKLSVKALSGTVGIVALVLGLLVLTKLVV